MVQRRTQTNRTRIVVLLAVVAVWSVAILARLTQLQVFRHQEYAEKARAGQSITIKVPAPRGVIYDSALDELASNVPAKTIVAEPKDIKDIPRAARRIAEILSLDYGDLLKRMSDPNRRKYLVVKRRVEPELAARVAGVAPGGISLIEESRRVYPNGSLASHVLGFIGMEDKGQAGLELRYEKDLQGKTGTVSVEVDAIRRSFASRVLEKPVQGHSLVLSISRPIQYLAERELTAGLAEFKSKSGVVIVMETETGRILAMASRPAFDGNALGKSLGSAWKNPAVAEMFEPGSTFKVVPVSWALEAGLTRKNEQINCLNGVIRIAGHAFHDHKPYQSLSVLEVIKFSSNVGAATLGQRLGKDRLYSGIRTFGFGMETGIDLPDEIAGRVNVPKNWSDISIGAISFGHEVGVTSIQAICAINSIATGGYLVRPSLVDRVISPEGELVRMNEPKRTRIISPGTAAAMFEGFEAVVKGGTGKKAELEGYAAAGKTGTANMVEDVPVWNAKLGQVVMKKTYSKRDYVASFIGFAPLPRPKITILVRVNAPRGSIYGGDVAAPVFRRIAQEALLELHVAPDGTLPRPTLNPAQLAALSKDFLPEATPALPLGDIKGTGPAVEDVVRIRLGDSRILVPDFTGMAKRTVLDRCRELGLELKASGSGVAVYQAPVPGTEVSRGDECRVTFGRARLARGVPVRPPAAGLALDRPKQAGPDASRP